MAGGFEEAEAMLQDTLQKLDDAGADATNHRVHACRIAQAKVYQRWRRFPEAAENYKANLSPNPTSNLNLLMM